MSTREEHFSADDEAWMRRALALASRGLYTTTPNPRVGCVIVKDGKLVGEGWHARAGEAHAEVHALRAAGTSARGATAYVTLEPCAHYGRTPPCALALVEAGLGRVVAAMRDPNPLVAGKGLRILDDAGIETAAGLLEDEARALNEGFIARMLRGRPWLRLKSAASLDGRTALAGGESQWITSAEARADAHRWRARSCAILTGVGTVLADNPQLNVRGLDTPRQPLRIVADSRLRTPLDARVLQGGNTLIVCGVDDPARHRPYLDLGAEILCLPCPDGHLDLVALATELGRRGLNEVLVEGGATLNGALIDAGLADALLLYLAPTLLGHSARGMFTMAPLAQLADKPELDIDAIERIGPDLRVTARFGLRA